ncbi:MAG TPA: hydroxyisourate hydrolase [Trebonia sp.]|nr:hydroxyisourate hydrolase [Trebonia sp.]
MSGEAGRATVSTHVLDASAGVPAGGVLVVLEGRAADGSWQIAGRAVTDGDGRARFPGDVAAGDYRLTFGTGAYFAARGTPSFYPEVTVTFAVASGHYHVPLLLSPFAYSTYRGS